MFKEKNFYVTIKVKIMKKLTFFYIKNQILLRKTGNLRSVPI